MQLGQLILIFLDLLVQLGVVLGIEQVPRLHRVAGRHIDPGNLRGGGRGISNAVGGHGGAGAFNDRGQAAVGGGLGQSRLGLILKEKGLDAKASPNDHRRRHDQGHGPLDGELPPCLF